MFILYPLKFVKQNHGSWKIWFPENDKFLLFFFCLLTGKGNENCGFDRFMRFHKIKLNIHVHKTPFYYCGIFN